MAIKVLTTEFGTLRRRLREISAQTDPRSGPVDRLRTDLKKILVGDLVDMLTHRGTEVFAGEDRFGHSLAPPAKSTRKKWPSRGFGFVLAPRGLGSRPITNFQVKWVMDGSSWRCVAGWVGIPWMAYHLTGSNHHPLHPNWRLPKRDVSPPSLKGWVQIRERFARFAANLARKGSSSA